MVPHGEPTTLSLFLFSCFYLNKFLEFAKQQLDLMRILSPGLRVKIK